MRRFDRPWWRAVALGAGIAIVGAGLLGGAFVLSGLYNVAASREHFAITNAIIRLTLTRSVATRSMGIEAPDLSDERLAALGARHFASGCAPCHASPASVQNPIAAEMYPAPPALTQAAEEWNAAQLFWIVKHGLKFTGMPSWPALTRDDEVWALVAFLERLPESNAEEYAALAGSEGGAEDANLNFGEGRGRTEAFCDNCHGDAENPPVHPLAPSLAGQKEPYLLRALEEYAGGKRPSGMMQAVAAALAPEELARLAGHYAGQTGTATTPSDGEDEAIARGEEIARNGVREDDIPACLACHRAGTSGQFPRLDGLAPEYISTQLSLFREGARYRSTYSAIMRPIAERLSERQIEDLATYFASLSRQPGLEALPRPEASR